jgi:hypothetical protein
VEATQVCYSIPPATLVSLSGVEFGIQYIDMPDAFANGALTPIDEINVLGAGGEILFSIPVTGDLASLF